MPKVQPSPAKLSNQQKAYAGMHYVAAEIYRRGGFAKIEGDVSKGARLSAEDSAHDNSIEIRVKTKTRGTWQPSTDSGHPREEPIKVEAFWVLVDLGPTYPEFYVVPEWWMENNIYEAHQDYLAQHGGHRAQNDDSKHHAIPVHRVEQWKDRWGILGILP